MLKISHASTFRPGLHLVISAKLALKICVAEKATKPLFQCSRSMLLMPLESVCTNSYYQLIVTMAVSHFVSEIKRLIGWKSQFFTLLSFSAFAKGDPFRSHGIALRILKLVFYAATAKIW